MKVILLETITTLGSVGDVVDVKPGYARNYLMPQKKALIASPRNMNHLEHQKLVVEHKLVRVRKASEELRKKIEKEGIKIKRKAGEQEKLFGSVTTQDIEEALRKGGIIVSRKGITMDEPIRKLGMYQVPVRLDGGVEAHVTVEVVADSK